MKKGQIRDSQLASLIKEELEYILCAANDSRISELSITLVQPKPGGGHFIIFVAPQEGSGGFSSLDEMKAVLKSAGGYLRSELSGSINLKRVPELTFMPDPLYSYPWGKE